MSKFESIMDELKDMGYVDTEGRVTLPEKSNGKSAKVEELEEADFDDEIEDDPPEAVPEPAVAVESSQDFTQVLSRLSMLATGLAEGMAKFAETVDTLKVLVESVQEEDRDQGEDDGEIPESE